VSFPPYSVFRLPHFLSRNRRRGERKGRGLREPGKDTNEPQVSGRENKMNPRDHLHIYFMSTASLKTVALTRRKFWTSLTSFLEKTLRMRGK